MATLGVAIVACAQWNFTVDPTFQTQLVQQNVNSLLLNEDGTVIASGRMRLPGELTDRYMMRFQNTGMHDPSFQNTGAGGGKLTRWQDRMYVGHAQTLRRMMLNGAVDPTFGSPNLFPCRYFNSLQGGDYHVYPDGSVLISGNHQLHDSIRGFVGRHQLMWLTPTGCLDTTRTHRTGGQCAVYRFKELPNGQFICNTTCDQFDGQEIDKIFRVNANGSVDTTFRTGVDWGATYDYLPLEDGRVYVAGNFIRTEAPDDTLRLVRFLPNGDLDPDFLIAQFTAGEGLSTPFGATAHGITRWRNGTLIITGQFKKVNGQLRKGICMIDTTGQLLAPFDGQGVGPFTFSTITNAALLRPIFNLDSTQMYVCGSYSGYDNGLTNYPEQRFITRLNVQEITTDVEEQEEAQPVLHLWPNPNEGRLWLGYSLPGHAGTVQLQIRDAQGRIIHNMQAAGAQGQLVWDTRGIAAGVYIVELLRVGQVEHIEKLVIRP